MKKELFATAFAAALLTASCAWGQDQPGNQPPPPNSQSNAWGATKDTVGHGIGMVSAELPASTPRFVRSAAMSDMYEIASAKIALQRSQSGDVRNFAREMIHDHATSTEKLKETLARANMGIALPRNFDDRHQSLIDDLRAARDADFDRRYIDQQTAAHREARTLLSGYAHKGDNPPLRHFAHGVLPVVQMHLAMARRIENRISVASR